MFTEKGKTLAPSRRLQAKGEMSTLQTCKDTNICERFINGLNLYTKMLSGNKKYIFSKFQLYVRVYEGVWTLRPWLCPITRVSMEWCLLRLLSYQPRSQGSLSCFEKEPWLRLVTWINGGRSSTKIGRADDEIVTCLSFWVVCKLRCFRIVSKDITVFCRQNRLFVREFVLKKDFCSPSCQQDMENI